MGAHTVAAAKRAIFAAGECGTVASARRNLMREFRRAGLDTPELDARVLIGHALSLDHAGLAAAADRRLETSEANAIAAFARRRLEHEPVARIVGKKEFWSLELRVGAATLVPRPESETVIEAALAVIDAGGPRERPLQIADLGTGSGALLLALLKELPRAFGVGTDIDRAALAVARDNAQRLGLCRAGFVACDFASAIKCDFDLIVSNPPYVASTEIAGLAAEVRDHDPRAALDGGPDGLDAYRAIAATVPTLIASDGALILELGVGQAPEVATLLTRAGLAPSTPRTDLRGLPRALIARKRHK